LPSDFKVKAEELLMVSTKLWAVVVAALVGCVQSEPSTPLVTAATNPAFDAARAPTVEFSVPDMMCEDGCAQVVAGILERQPGVKEVRVDFQGKTATVGIDEKAFDSQQALAALIDKGFDHSKLATASNAAVGAERATPEVALQAAPATQ
jgi:copper chaperone CopZ